MGPRMQSKVRLSLEALEDRAAPAALGPVGMPWLEAVLADLAQSRPAESAGSHSHGRPFHLEETGSAVINPDGTISGSASGHATHLGRFRLRDTSTIVGSAVTPDGLVLQIVGRAELEAANGDKLYASLSGTVNMTTGVGTLSFEWTGGTGRFVHATGSTAWLIKLNPDLTYSAVADGVINY